MSGTQDYAVKVTIRNGRILSRMRAKGIKTLTELARKAGIPYHTLCEIVALRKRPIGVRGLWVNGIENVAGVLMCDPDDLFTDAQRENAIERNSGEIFMDEPDAIALTAGDPEREYWIKTEAQRLLASLPNDRLREVVERRVAGETYNAIGEDLGVTGHRIRQLEHEAHRKMRAVARRAGYTSADLDGDAA